jgi:endonuclease I
MHKDGFGWIVLAVLALGTLLWGGTVLGGYEPPDPQYDAPSNYYANAVGTGTTLRTNLHNIISTGFTAVSYGDARGILPVLWQDPSNSSNLILVYTDASIPKPTGGSIAGWDDGVSWNREHMWPQSKLGISVDNNTKNAGSDLFELAPSNPSVNSSRSNDAYGIATSSGTYQNNSTYFFPGDAQKGDVARAMFYMATRYFDGTSTPSTNNLTIVSGLSPATYQIGDLQSLLAWNYEDGVDNFERRKNDLIYDNYQHNRDPFIDHPEYVWAIFGTDLNGSGQIVNNSQLYLGNSAPASDGSSTVTVDLGRVMVNGTLGTSNVAFNKTGSDPTTFDLTTAGNAAINSGGTSNLIAGVGQGIDFNSQSRTINVGLNAATSTTGLKTGTITLHNSDLTTSGVGHGSADANDTINITASVLAKRVVTPSVSSVTFGTVIVGAPLSSSFNLTTTGDDNSATRVNVAGSSSVDANGMQITGTTSLFNSATSMATRSLGGMLNSAGSKSGSLSLVVTTAENGGSGLVGEGSYPAISVGYSATVLDHAKASFSGSQDLNSLAINFGRVGQNSGTHEVGFSLFNLVATPGFTAGLDLNTASGSGDAASLAVLTSNISAFSNLAAGNSAGFNTDLATSNLGSFSVVYMLGLADNSLLPGATVQAPLTLTLSGIVTAYAAGDFNLDHHVDAADVAAMLSALTNLSKFQSTNDLTDSDLLEIGDVNGDGKINNADLQALLEELRGGGGSGGAVPEPVSAPLLLLAVIGCATLYRPRSLARQRPTSKTRGSGAACNVERMSEGFLMSDADKLLVTNA